MKRRTYLRSTAVGVTGVAVAGCLGGDDGGDPQVEIDYIDLFNSVPNEGQTASVEVTLDGDVVYEETHDLDGGMTPDEAVRIEDLPDDSGVYELSVGLEGRDGDPFQGNPAEAAQDDCITVQLEILDAGEGPEIFQNVEAC